MAVKHVVTSGLGFTVPSYLLTEGFGNFGTGGGTGTPLRGLRRLRGRSAAIIAATLLLLVG